MRKQKRDYENLVTPCAAVNLENGAKETRTPDPLHAMKGMSLMRQTAGEEISQIAVIQHYWISTCRLRQR